MNFNTSITNYSEYSERFGFSKVENIVQYAVKNKLSSIALTDVGTLYGAIDFIRECKKNNIKPILGVTFNLESNTEDNGFDGLSTGTITLIAKNKEGYKNLNRLIAKQNKDNSLRMPVLSSQHLKEFSDNLICVTGNRSSMLGRKIINGDQSVDSAVAFLKKIYGDNLFLEHGLYESDSSLNEQVTQLCEKHNLNIVPTNHSRFIAKSDMPLFKRKVDSSFSDNNRKEYQGYFHDFITPKDAFVPSSQITSYFENNNLNSEAISKAVESIDNYDIGRDIEFPSVSWSKEEEFIERIQNAFNEFLYSDYFKNLIKGKMQDKEIKLYKKEIARINGLNISQEEKRLQVDATRKILENARDRVKHKLIVQYNTRLNEELKIIRNCNGFDFTRYFATLMGFKDVAKDVGSSFSIRGSSLSSLTVYLAIEGYKSESMSVDPIENDLLFQRFLNPERGKYPDIDLDLGKVKEVLEEFSTRFHKGRESGTGMAYIVTPHSQFASLDSIIQGVSKAMIDSKELQNFLIKQKLIKQENSELNIQNKIDVLKNILIKKYRNIKKEKIDIIDVFKDNPDISNLVQRDDFYKIFLQQAKKIQNNCNRIYKGSSKRIVMSNNDLTSGEFSVTRESSEGENSVSNVFLEIQTPSDYIEKVMGLIKYDLLPSIAINNTEYALKDISEKYNKVCDTSMYNMLNDDEITKMFDDNLLAEIFQINTKYARDIASKVKINSFEDVINLSGLLRPGPNIHIDKYIERSNGNYNKSIHPVLDSTFGIILFEEQIIKIGQQVGFLTDGEAERLRLSLKEKDSEELASLKKKFISNAKGKAVKDNLNPIKAGKDAEEIFNYVEEMSGYTFNKGHAIRYAMIAYQQMWIKKNFPAEYIDYMHLYEGESVNGKKENVFKLYIENELPKMNVSIKALNVNTMDIGFKTALNSKNEKCVVFCMSKFLKNPAIANIIVDSRPENGFKNKTDFIHRVIDEISNHKKPVSLLKSFKEVAPLLMGSGKVPENRAYLSDLYKTNMLASLVPKEYSIEDFIAEISNYGGHKISDNRNANQTFNHGYRQQGQQQVFNQGNSQKNNGSNKPNNGKSNNKLEYFPSDHISLWNDNGFNKSEVIKLDIISPMTTIIAMEKAGLVRFDRQNKTKLKVYHKQANVNSPIIFFTKHQFTFYAKNMSNPSLSGTLNFIMNLSEAGIIDDKINNSIDAFNYVKSLYNNPQFELKKMAHDESYNQKIMDSMGIATGVKQSAHPNIIPKLFTNNDYNQNDLEYERVYEYLIKRRAFDRETLDKLYHDGKMGITILRPSQQGRLNIKDFKTAKTLVFLLQDQNHKNNWGQSIDLDKDQKDGIYQERSKTSQAKEYAEKNNRKSSGNSKYNITGAQEDCVFRMHYNKPNVPIKNITFSESVYDAISRYELNIAQGITDTACYGVLGKGGIFKWFENELNIYVETGKSETIFDLSNSKVFYMDEKINLLEPNDEVINKFLTSNEVTNDNLKYINDKLKKETIIPEVGEQKTIYFQVDKNKTFKQEMEAFERIFKGRLKVEYIDDGVYKPRGKQLTGVLINKTNFEKFLRTSNFAVDRSPNGQVSIKTVEKIKEKREVTPEIIDKVHSHLKRYFGDNPISMGLEFDKDEPGISALPKFDLILKSLNIKNTSAIPHVNAPDDLNDVLINYKEIRAKEGEKKALVYASRYDAAKMRVEGISQNPSIAKKVHETYSEQLSSVPKVKLQQSSGQNTMNNQRKSGGQNPSFLS